MTTTTDTDREIVITRRVAAPRELVWRVWTNPAHVDKWWGPNGSTNKTLSHDLRVGGEWKYTMTGPDGTVFPNLITDKEVLPVHRLVCDHGDLEDPKVFEAIITFDETDDGTIVTMRSIFHSKEARDFVAKEYRAIEGGEQTLARLDEYLSSMKAH